MTQSTPDPRDLLPLSPAVFGILLALADEDLHGYAIMQRVGARADGSPRIGPGTLYSAIRRLLADGLVEESTNRPAAEHDDERRRYYRLTGFGRRVAGAEAARLEGLVRHARRSRLLPAESVAAGHP